MPYKKFNGKNVKYYVMSPDPVFGITSVIIAKNGKALLVDTQFSADDAAKIIEILKDENLNLETIYISHNDPDFYFGTSFIKEVFPAAKVCATNEVIDKIKATYESKLIVWADTLKDKAPKEIIIPEPIESQVELEGEVFKIIGKDKNKTVLFNPIDQLILGGILIYTDKHLFMADTKTITSQQQWIESLTELENLNPILVIPGHFDLDNKFLPSNIDFTKQYLENFISAEEASKTSMEIIQKMKDYYPGLPDAYLEMSAKVVTGEMDWA